MTGSRKPFTASSKPKIQPSRVLARDCHRVLPFREASEGPFMSGIVIGVFVQQTVIEVPLGSGSAAGSFAIKNPTEGPKVTETTEGFFSS